MLQFLTVADAIQIHQQLLQRYGGREGLRDAGLLESAIMSVPQHAFYSPQADILELAVTYLANLIQNHPFVDGNKRTAVGMMLLFLALHHQPLTLDAKLLEDYVVQLAAGELSSQTFLDWLRSQV